MNSRLPPGRKTNGAASPLPLSARHRDKPPNHGHCRYHYRQKHQISINPAACSEIISSAILRYQIEYRFVKCFIIDRFTQSEGTKHKYQQCCAKKNDLPHVCSPNDVIVRIGRDWQKLYDKSRPQLSIAVRSHSLTSPRSRCECGRRRLSS